MSKKLGTLVKKARTEKGMTQAELAKKISGLAASDISKIELGKWEPDKETLKKMAKPLGLTQKALLEAASGASASAAKSSSKTAAKTSSGKTGSAKKTSSSGKSGSTKKTEELTAEEKKLLKLYRKADDKVKKQVMNLLDEKSALEGLLGNLLSGKNNALEQLLGGKSDVLENLGSLLKREGGAEENDELKLNE